MKKRRESYCQRERGERREDTCLLGFCLGTEMLQDSRAYNPVEDVLLQGVSKGV